MSILVLAEKPSVARDIARVLGAGRKAEGFLEGQGYRVTWALGHLVHFAEPDDYGGIWAGRWSLAQLPMIPERWQLRTDSRTVNQLRIIQGLLNAPDTQAIICATDAGREGEHIFRLIYEYARCRKPVQRLWVSSLTDEAIREGFVRLQPGTAFDPLAQAARARAQADWLVGMNLTRAYTVHNRVLCTIGRVQTPTLAMIVARDQAIACFVRSFFYELVATLAEGFRARYCRDGETRLDNRAEAERLQRELAPHGQGRVKRVDVKVRHNHPPPLYDLTSLQRDANRRFGLTAAQVLEQAQALYETHKLISYPRTESRHISEDMLPKLPGILQGLEHPLAAEALARLKGGHKLGKAYVDSTKLTDHHAILPTGRSPPAALPEMARRLYDLVVARFVAIFLPDEQVEETRVSLDIGGAEFVAHGTRVLDSGWKVVEPPRRRAVEGEEGEEASLPPLRSGQVVHITSLDVLEKETQPPRPYDDATLLAAMKNAGREIEDDVLAAAMKASGLGTPATRAEIIEKLIRTGYVERQRKALRSTIKGQALISLVAEPLRSPELTAQWEQRLKDVEQGQAQAEDFYADILAWLREIIPTVSQGPILTPEQVAAATAGSSKSGRGHPARTQFGRATDLGPCPLCQKGQVVETAKAFGCSRYREGCGLTLWKTMAGQALNLDQIRQLLNKGHTDRIEGFVARSGRPFRARLRLNQAGRLEFDFDVAREEASSLPIGLEEAREGLSENTTQSAEPEVPPGPLSCPKCRLGHIIEGRRGFGCDRFREGCDFVVWKEVAGRRLSEGQIRRLIATGHTGLIRGFTDGRGASLDAWLRLDTQWRVTLDFDPVDTPGG